MRPRGLRVVPRADVDLALRNSKIERLCNTLVKSKRSTLRMFVQAAALSREQFVSIQPYQLALETIALSNAFEHCERAERHQAQCEAARASPELLELYWADTQRHGHTLSVIGMSGPALGHLANGDFHTLTDGLVAHAFRFGSLSTCARTLWASAQWGQKRFDYVKQHLADPLSTTAFVGNLLELAVIGFSHDGLFDEAKALVLGDTSRFSAELRAVLGPLQPAFERAFRSPLESLQGLEETGLRLMRSSGLRADSRFEALQTALLQPLNLWAPQANALTTLVLALPFIGQCLPEELYLPEAVLTALALRTPGRKAIEANVQAVRRMTVQTPVVRSPKTGRNELCACGSGQKFKRCCLGV
jgi:hypothetical protein